MNTMYGLDSTRVTLREFRFGTPLLLMPIATLTKFCRIPLPGSTDDPPVESLQPFEVEPSTLPEEVRAKFEPLEDQLAALDFGQPIYHFIQLPHLATRIYWATFLHRDGQVVARIHHRVWASPEGLRTYLFPQFLSMLEDGTFVVSSGGKPDMLTPESVRLFHHPGAKVETLWQQHIGHLNDALPRSTRAITHHEQLRAVLECHHAEVRDFNLERGVFTPLPADLATASPATGEPVAAVNAEDAAVLAEIEKIQTQKRGWGTAIFVLVVSILLFVAATHWQFGLGEFWALIPVLFFHEMGHYLAMRWFGYRNLRMFFIPFFGAAVTGRNYNVAGWKKAVVALMGPVPGIALGLVLALAGAFVAKAWLIHLALMCVILNGFNLLPFLPLDGGWVLHAVLFARHPVLDLLFRLVAIGGLVTLGLLSGGWILCYLGIPMLIALPVSFQVARIAHRLRKGDAISVSPDSQTIPPEAVTTILAELRTAFPSVLNPKTMAVYVTNIFETLNARPPGLLASVAILFVHGASIVVAIVAAVICAFGLGGDFRGTLQLITQRPAHRYEAKTTRVWHGPQAAKPSGKKPITLIATYGDAETAGQLFAALPAELPPQTTMRLFGETLLITFPGNAAGEQASKPWVDRLEADAVHFVVDRPKGFLPAQVFCVVPTEEGGKEIVEELEQYFHAPLSSTLMPPWSAAWQGLPDAQRDRYQLARRTYARLEHLHIVAREIPEYKALEAELAVQLEQEDRVAVRKLTDRLDQMLRAEITRRAAALGNPGEEPVDPKVVELWQKSRQLGEEHDALEVKLEEQGDKGAAPLEKQLELLTKAQQKYQQMLAQLMGQVPQVANREEPADSVEGARNASVARRGLYLAIRNITFVQPAEGLPALAEWLHARQGDEIYYGFENPLLEALRKGQQKLPGD